MRALLVLVVAFLVGVALLCACPPSSPVVPVDASRCAAACQRLVAGRLVADDAGQPLTFEGCLRRCP